MVLSDHQQLLDSNLTSYKEARGKFILRNNSESNPCLICRRNSGCDERKFRIEPIIVIDLLNLTLIFDPPDI